VNPARDAEDLAGQLDDLVKPAAEPENAVLVDNARVIRWAGPAFALFALILLPWTVYLASACVWLSLHTQQLAERRPRLLLRRSPKRVR
jgi:hypothetical protein